ISGIAPLDVRPSGVAVGDHVRSIGFGRAGDGQPAGIKLLRDHVRVQAISDAEFIVGEATCQGDSGGPALDEDTGEIVGVVSRGGPNCEGNDVHNVYTRVDVFSWLVEDAFNRVATPSHGDAGTTPAPRGTKRKPPSDM